MKRATLPLIIVLLVAGLIAGQVLSSYVLSSGSSGIFMILCAIIFLVGFFAFAIWQMVSSSGKVKVADSALRRDVIKFEPHPDLATLYIARPQIVGIAIALPIIINDVNTIWTKGKTFYRLDLPAGTYTLTGNKKCKKDLSLNLNAGEITYVEQEILVGMMSGGYGFNQTNDPVAAHKDIQVCKLLQAPEIK